LAFSSDADLAGFLSVLKSSARNVYGRGLRLLPRREGRRVATQVLNDLCGLVVNRGYAPKTVRVHVWLFHQPEPGKIRKL